MSATLFVTPKGASLAREIGDFFADCVNVLDYGATINGVTDDRAAIMAASAAAGSARVLVIPGGATGQLHLATSAAVPAAVLLLGAELTPTSSLYSGKTIVGISDKNWFLRADRGATAYGGTPTAYTVVDDLAGVLQRFNNAAGYQQHFLSDDGGRTQIAANLLYATHSGYGDVNGWFGNMSAAKHPFAASATSWTGRNSVTLFGGQLGATTDSVNVYGAEFALTDSGKQSVAALGLVLNFHRTATQAVSYRTPWLGIRVQSPLSSQRCDAIFQRQGQWRVWLDLTPASFDDAQAAIVLKQGQRFYFGADASASPANWFAGDGNNLGGSFITDDGLGFALNVGGSCVLRGKTTKQAQLVPIAGDPTSIADGDIWYNSVVGKFRGCAAGAIVDLH